MELLSPATKGQIFIRWVSYRNRLRVWAYDNACMLAFMLALNIITWSLIIISILV